MYKLFCWHSILFSILSIINSLEISSCDIGFWNCTSMFIVYWINKKTNIFGSFGGIFTELFKGNNGADICFRYCRGVYVNCVVCTTQRMEPISMGFLVGGSGVYVPQTGPKGVVSVRVWVSHTVHRAYFQMLSGCLPPTPPSSSYPPLCVSRSRGALTPILLTACPACYRRLGFCLRAPAATAPLWHMSPLYCHLASLQASLLITRLFLSSPPQKVLPPRATFSLSLQN